ncbi:hypothetical protein AB1Y20_001501 [Prymnesium parvum]|uniref:NADP-dependent oxidoreductase domain-containing protein n=1 Tax=Prymnesium parvum TaxID=97485 RepID=A0AB34K8J7_PRYPA
MLSLLPLASTVAFALNIPTVQIAPGVHLPMAGLGTWQYNDSRAELAVSTALAIGYTHIDTANVYGNAKGIGKALAQSPRPRDSYFITSKVPGGLNASATIAAHQLTLSQLGLKYVDLLLIHFPTTMTASPVGSKAMRQEQWKGMEALHKQGLARSIGVSHFCQRHVEDVLEIATVKVAVNQVQYHVGMGPAGNQANDDRSFDEKMGILYQSFSPLCGPCGTSELINGKLVTSIGAAHNKTGAQVSLKWLVQQGIPVIPKSSVESHLKENIDLFDWELTQSEMDALSAASTPAVAGGDPGPPATSGDCTLP